MRKLTNIVAYNKSFFIQNTWYYNATKTRSFLKFENSPLSSQATRTCRFSQSEITTWILSQSPAASKNGASHAASTRSENDQFSVVEIPYRPISRSYDGVQQVWPITKDASLYGLTPRTTCRWTKAKEILIIGSTSAFIVILTCSSPMSE